MTNWFIQDGKVLTVDGKIRGCCCAAPWVKFTRDWGSLGWARTGSYLPAGVMHFTAYVMGTHFTHLHACGEMSTPAFVPNSTASYTIFVPEDCEEIYSGDPPTPNLHYDAVSVTTGNWWWEES